MVSTSCIGGFVTRRFLESRDVASRTSFQSVSLLRLSGSQKTTHVAVNRNLRSCRASRDHHGLNRTAGKPISAKSYSVEQKKREPIQVPQVETTGADLAVWEEELESELLSIRKFLTSERAKVVAMVAMAMALCNADRVIMSVAIVPLCAAHGWSQSFAGVVQVRIPPNPNHHMINRNPKFQLTLKLP